jgi:hypothetical protein
MGKLIEEAMTAGWLVSTEGCLPSSLGARVRLSDGKFTITEGLLPKRKNWWAASLLSRRLRRKKRSNTLNTSCK